MGGQSKKEVVVRFFIKSKELLEIKGPTIYFRVKRPQDTSVKDLVNDGHWSKVKEDGKKGRQILLSFGSGICFCPKVGVGGISCLISDSKFSLITVG